MTDQTLKVLVCDGTTGGYPDALPTHNRLLEALDTKQGRRLTALAAIVYVPRAGSRALLQQQLAEGAEVDCNLYNYVAQTWIPTKHKGQYPNKRIGHTPRSRESDRFRLPFSQQGNMVFHDETLYMVDLLEGSQTASVLGIQMEKMSKGVFLPAQELIQQNDRLESMFSFSMMDSTANEYLKDYPLLTTVLAFDRAGLSQLTLANALVPGIPAGQPKPDSYLAWTELRAAPGGGTRRVVALHDLTTRAQLDVATPHPELDYTAPSLCERWMALQSFDETANSSRAWLYDIHAEAVEVLAVSSAAAQSFRPQMVAVASLATRVPPKDKRCRLAWLETAAPVTLDPDGQTRLHTPTGGADDVVIRLMELPAKMWVSPLFPRHWQVSTAAARYEVLMNTLISGDQLFLLLRTASGAVADSWLVRRYDLRLGEFSTVKESALPLHLHSVSDQTLMYFRELPDGALQMLVYHIVFVPSKNKDYTTKCSVGQGMNISRAAIFEDVVFWQEETAAGWSELYMLDINKDNDALPDVTDMFPLMGEFAFDSDNDDIGDEGDFIRAQGPCTRSSRRGACLSDNDVLYIVWGVYVLVVGATCWHIIAWYQRKRKEAEERVGEQDAMAGDPLSIGDSVHGLPSPIDTPVSVMRSAFKSRRHDSSHSDTSEHNPRRRRLSLDIGTGTGRRDSLDFEPDAGMKDDTGENEEHVAEQVKMALLIFAGQVALLVLTIVSVIIATIPFYSTSVEIRERNIYIWCDFFIVIFFLADLVIRCSLRNRTKVPSVLGFMRSNWTDCLALFVDIPGVTGVGALSFLVLTRFRHLIRLFRVARILKIFRVVRLYRRFMRHNALIELMINRPTMFLMLFMALIVLLSSAAIKILEQGHQDKFKSFPDVVWFTVVTITTVGYGDMVPRTIVARCITAILMVIGIGILGLLTATMLKSLLVGGKSAEKLEQRRRVDQYRTEMLQTVATRMAVAYNPMVSIFGESYEKAMGAPNFETMKEVHAKHQSDFISGPGLNLAVQAALPIDALMAQNNAGKMSGAATPGGQQLDAELVKRRERAERQRKALRKVLSDASTTEQISPQTRLFYVLKYYRLDDPKTGVANYDRFSQELADIIFFTNTPFQLFMEKVVCLHEAMDSMGNFKDGKVPDLQDPLDIKLVRVEDVLKRHGVHKRLDYQEVILEITLLAIMYDRVQNARWALQNICYRKDVKMPPPPYLDEETYLSFEVMIPNFTFVGRKTPQERNAWHALNTFLGDSKKKANMQMFENSLRGYTSRRRCASEMGDLDDGSSTRRTTFMSDRSLENEEDQGNEGMHSGKGRKQRRPKRSSSLVLIRKCSGDDFTRESDSDDEQKSGRNTLKVDLPPASSPTDAAENLRLYLKMWEMEEVETGGAASSETPKAEAFHASRSGASGDHEAPVASKSVDEAEDFANVRHVLVPPWVGRSPDSSRKSVGRSNSLSYPL